MDKPPKSARQQLRELYFREAAEVRRMRHSGECTGEDRPKCYERCPHSYYCSELRHITMSLY